MSVKERDENWRLNLNEETLTVDDERHKTVHMYQLIHNFRIIFGIIIMTTYMDPRRGVPL